MWILLLVILLHNIIGVGENMDREQLQRSIEEADNNSLRVGAANRIVQLLQKLRYSNNENSAKHGYGNSVKMPRMLVIILVR